MSKSQVRAWLLSSVAFFGAPATTFAGDLAIKAPQAPYLADRPWYIQVEGGVGIFSPTNADPGIIYGNVSFGGGGTSFAYTESLWGGGGPIVGGRVGYQISPWFRADISVQYMSFTLTGHFDEVVGSGFSCGPPNGPGNCSLNATRAAWATVELVNGYIDLDPIIGQHGHWHPYVTAGVGAAQDNLGANCVSCDYGTRNGSNSTNKFAWAAGLGTRVDLLADVKLDLAWRYLDLGRFEGGNNGNTSLPRNFTGNDSFRVHVQSFTLGVAYPF